MKKLFTLLFAVALVTAASAQSGDRYRNDSRNNSYQSSSNYDRGYSNQYSRNSQWNDRRHHSRYESTRQRIARERYEMMMRRNRARYHHSYVPYRQPAFHLSIGIGGRR